MAPVEYEPPQEFTSEMEEGLTNCSLDHQPFGSKTLEINPTHTQRPPHLLDVPLEIRQCIYDFIFQPTLNNSLVHRPEQRRGCGLSLTCSQLYGETRIRYYNCAKYRFDSPRECWSFLDQVGRISHHIGSLHIILDDDLSDVEILRDIFDILLPVSELHTLRLELFRSRPSTSPPLYFSAARISDPAAYYDICLRPARHPLAKIKSVRSLKVGGRTTNGELEEAIVKLGLNMDEVARAERKTTTATERCRQFTRLSKTTWFYILRITDLPV